MITTIQITNELKGELQKYKKSSKDTYEDVIKKLILEKKNSKIYENNILREGYEEIYGLSKEINEDFENIDLNGIEENEY